MAVFWLCDEDFGAKLEKTETGYVVARGFLLPKMAMCWLQNGAASYISKGFRFSVGTYVCVSRLPYLYLCGHYHHCWALNPPCRLDRRIP